MRGKGRERERERGKAREREGEREREKGRERERESQGPDHNLSHQPPQVGPQQNTGGDLDKLQMGPTTKYEWGP